MLMNKNPLSTIEKLLDLVVPYYTNNHIIPRGTIYPIDPIFSGNFYNMLQWGNGYDTLLYSGNVCVLTEAVGSAYTEISVDVILPFMEVGNLLTIGDSNDTVRVISINEETRVLQVSSGSAPHAVGSTVTINAKKCLVESDTIVTSPYAILNRVVFRTNQPILVGATLTVIVSADYQNKISYVITEIVDVTTDGTDYIYDVRLDYALFNSLTYGDAVYLVSYPYYISKELTIPYHFSSKAEQGPFLIDYTSINMKDTVVETDYRISVYDTLGNTIIDSVTAPNYPIYYRDIDSSTFMFSDVLVGRVGYNTAGEFIGYIEDEGEFRCYTELQPQIETPSGISWEFDVTFVGNARFFVDITEDAFHYASYYVSGSNATITVTPESGKLMKGILFGIEGSAGSYIKMGNWKVNTKATTIKYSILSKTLEPSLWLGSGLLIKPLFPILDDIKFIFGKTLFNNGKVFL